MQGKGLCRKGVFFAGMLWRVIFSLACGGAVLFYGYAVFLKGFGKLMPFVSASCHKVEVFMLLRLYGGF